MAYIENYVSNLYGYLMTTDRDEIILRTTRVRGGWHEVEADANRAGYRCNRYNDPVLESRHEFSECYKLTRVPKAN